MRTTKPAASRSSHLLAVGLGGAIGTALRAALTQGIDVHRGWPWPTFVANIVGTALLITLILRAPRLMVPTGTARSFLGVGVCGGLTTFSLFQVEIIGFLREGRVGLGLGYAAASIGAALIIVLAVPAKSVGPR